MYSHNLILLCILIGCRSESKVVPNPTVHTDARFRIQHVNLQKESVELIAAPHNAVSLIQHPESNTWTTIMNAGMFEPDHSPVGLQIIDGIISSPLNLDNGHGNFFLKPNGVLAFSTNDTVSIVESIDAHAQLDQWNFATQSGPLLLADKTIHPSLNPNSMHTHIRNGVCTQSDTTLVFIISNIPVRFYDMAAYMKDVLKCTDGLYLDGAVSVMYTRETSWIPEPTNIDLGSWLIIKPKFSN